MRKYTTALLLVLTVLYPLAVYVALGRIAPQWLALMLSVLAAGRALLTRQGLWWAVAAGAGVLAGVSWLQASPLAVKLYPVMVSLVLLGVFVYSLWQPPTVVERLARLQAPDLPQQAVGYTRQVTKVWCVFFIVNAAIALMTVCWASDAVWALYNGLLSYVLMGILMAGEWCVRQRVRGQHANAEAGKMKRKIG